MGPQSLFDGLPPEHLALVAEALDEVEVARGKRIARQGDFGYELFAAWRVKSPA